MHHRRWLLLLCSVALSGGGCGSLTWSVRELDYPVVLGASPFAAGGERFTAVEQGRYAGERSDEATGGSGITVFTWRQDAQIAASFALGGQRDRAITDLVFECEQYLMPGAARGRITATGLVREFAPVPEETP